MSEATELQAARRPAGPDLRAAAAGLSFKSTDVPTPLADGWHAHRRRPDSPREPCRFALFKSGQLVALVTRQHVPRSPWVWSLAVESGGDTLVAGRAELEQAMLRAGASLRGHLRGGLVSAARSARLLARWEGRDAGA